MFENYYVFLTNSLLEYFNFFPASEVTTDK